MKPRIVSSSRTYYAGRPGELLGHVEGLGEKPLDLAGARHGELVLVREFVHAEDGDDVLQVLVPLEHLLHGAGRAVVFLTHDLGSRMRLVEASGSTAG